MKIDFNAKYSEISKLLRQQDYRSTLGPDARAAFGKLLGAFSPEQAKKAQSAEPPIKEEAKLRSQLPPQEARASLRLKGPDLQSPRLSPTLPEGSAVAELKTEPPSIKSPTLLEARRVSLPGSAPPMPTAEIKTMIEKVGREQGLDPALALAVAAAESSFNPRAVSRDGHESKGLFQLLDSTAQTLIERHDLSKNYDPFDPATNVALGSRYLRYLHDIFNAETQLPNQHRTVMAANSASLEKLAVAAFNAGEGRVAAAQERAARAGQDPADFAQVKPYLPETTQQYVERVLHQRSRFSE